MPFHWAVQKAIVQGAMEQRAQIRDETTLQIDSSHSPFLSQVNATADFIRKAAGDTGK